MTYNSTTRIEPSKIKKNNFIIGLVDSISKRKQLKKLDILDVGCGHGDVSIGLAKLGHNVLGIDINESNIRAAQETAYGDNAVFKVLDACQIGLMNQKFDIVICSEVLEHLVIPDLLCKNINRIMRKGGVLIITLPNGFGPYEVLYETPRRYLEKLLVRIGFPQNVDDADEHKVNFTIWRLKKMLKDNGFRFFSLHNSDFISFFPFLRKTNFVNFDCRLADNLPYFFVSGWYIVSICEESC